MNFRCSLFNFFPVLKYGLLVLFFLAAYGIQAQTDTLATARETRVRHGLPNFINKLQKNQPVMVAYLGGSITQASNGYREQSAAWLQKQYPQAAISAINAGIGGTASDFGVFRVGSQVLVHKPDLVLVEFAVNDMNKAPQHIHETMEGIVRQIWQHNARTDILFVYTLTGDMATTLQAGKLPPAAKAMEDIAQYYNIPSVHMGLETVALAAAGKLIFKGKPGEHPEKIVFSGDNVHPYAETGHRLYTEALTRSFAKFIAQGKTGKYTHRLTKPFTAANWEKARMVSITEINRAGNWQEVPANDSQIKHLMPQPLKYVLKATTPGATLKFTFKGTRFGLNDVMGPGVGQYDIIIDGEAPKTNQRFDKHSTYYRAQYFVSPLLKPGLHTVEIRLSGNQLDKKTILQDNSKDLEANPEKYKENAGYAAALLLIGDLVK